MAFVCIIVVHGVKEEVVVAGLVGVSFRVLVLLGRPGSALIFPRTGEGRQAVPTFVTITIMGVTAARWWV